MWRMRETSAVERRRAMRRSGGPGRASAALAALGLGGLALARGLERSAGRLLRPAPLQRRHQVDDVLARLGGLRHGDRLARGLALDLTQELAAVVVLVALRLEARDRELLDQLVRQVELALLQLHRVAELDVVEAPHLVRVVEAVHHQAVLAGADAHELLA